MKILGISAFYHDSAAALVVDGAIVAAAQEERFTRKKHDESFPTNAVEYCLGEAGIKRSQLDYVVFYEKPFLKFDRLIENYLAFAPRGLSSFAKAIPLWLGDKLWMKRELEKAFPGIPVLFTEHHESHGASAFFASPFENALVLTCDGVGEWDTTTIGIGDKNRFQIQKSIRYPHSLGLLYSAFTYFTGFKVNSGEYKLMGLAPYGDPRYADIIRRELIDLKPDGSYQLNIRYFSYPWGLEMTRKKFAKLFGCPRRLPETPIRQVDMDLAASIQVVTEEALLNMVSAAHREYGIDNLCLAGGVALNCVANGRILREGPFKKIWIQPAAGDAGGALGAALHVYHEVLKQPRKVNASDSQNGSYLGPRFSTEEAEKALRAKGAVYEVLSDEELPGRVAALLAQDKVVGWVQGRMEFGPRALGNRSIIGNPLSAETQKTMNLKIKFRESFRPFAPSVLEEDISEYFELDTPSPYMLLVAPIRQKYRLPLEQKAQGLERLKQLRSKLPSITHVDYSARVQSVSAATNPRYHSLIKKFKELTGCGVIVNTSFNVRGEPIVCTPEDAYRCFMRTNMDYLVIENCLIEKRLQPPFDDVGSWQKEFGLD